MIFFPRYCQRYKNHAKVCTVIEVGRKYWKPWSIKQLAFDSSRDYLSIIFIMQSLTRKGFSCHGRIDTTYWLVHLFGGLIDWHHYHIHISTFHWYIGEDWEKRVRICKMAPLAEFVDNIVRLFGNDHRNLRGDPWYHRHILELVSAWLHWRLLMLNDFHKCKILTPILICNSRYDERRWIIFLPRQLFIILTRIYIGF